MMHKEKTPKSIIPDLSDCMDHLKAMCVALRLSKRVEVDVFMDSEEGILTCVAHLPKGTALCLRSIQQEMARHGFDKMIQDVWIKRPKNRDQDKGGCCVGVDASGVVEIWGFRGRQDFIEVSSCVVGILGNMCTGGYLDGMRDV